MDAGGGSGKSCGGFEIVGSLKYYKRIRMAVRNVIYDIESELEDPEESIDEGFMELFKKFSGDAIRSAKRIFESDGSTSLSLDEIQALKFCLTWFLTKIGDEETSSSAIKSRIHDAIQSLVLSEYMKNPRGGVGDKDSDGCRQEDVFEINNCEGLLTEEFIQIRFQLALRLLLTLVCDGCDGGPAERFADADVTTLKKQFDFAHRILEWFALKPCLRLEELKMNIEEVVSVIWCLRSLVVYSDSVDDVDFAEDLHHLSHSFAKSLSKRKN